MAQLNYRRGRANRYVEYIKRTFQLNEGEQTGPGKSFPCNYSKRNSNKN